ncbi:uncharacterized protein LOC120346261 isoform X2 [Styela clava]
MDNCCPPRLNHEYVKSVEGILKLSLIVIGVFCWGIVYIGDVMSTSNEAPEINDQVLFYSALTLPSWLLTLLTFIFYMFSRNKDAKSHYYGLQDMLAFRVTKSPTK